MTFDEAIQQHKDNLTKNLSEFGEGHRLNRLHKEIDSNAADYEYYFNAGQQSQQAKVEELQEEFAEDERFLKGQIKDKDLKISNLEYQLGMDKELIQSLQSKSEKLQKRVDAVTRLAQTLWEKSNEKHKQGKVWESKALGECADEILDVIEQALKGEG